MKKISVIIPCYNVAAYIDRCLMSIEAQTMGMEELEIICIDDASADSTWVHLRKWEQMYPENILLIQQKVNRRQGAARNLGVRYASADWIAFVDADDWLEPDYLEQLYGPAIKYECDIVSCEILQDVSDTLTCFDEVARTGEMKEQYIVVDMGKTRSLLFKDHLLDGGVPGKLIRKSFLMEYEEPPFCLFKLESEIIKQQVQEHRRHKYIADFEFTERVLLDLLYLSPDKQGFLQIIDGIKRLYTEQGKEKKKVSERKV